MSVKVLTVELGDRTYPIHFTDSLERLSDEVEKLKADGRSVYVLSDDSVLAAQPNVLKRAGFTQESILSVPAGEQSKSIQYFSQLLSALAGKSANRDIALFAFGGGVVGDLAGYLAASYLRGVDFYQIPTTLLAMVDSSVGGKTGINLPEGKNLVGAFWQPKAVYIEPKLLKTLPPREFTAGMAEVIKYGMLNDKGLFEELERLDPLSADSPELAAIIRRCCANKAEIVAADEKETAASGGRALLNLGHTFGHAIENVAGYGAYLHGEAIGIGLNLAAQLSKQLNQISQDDVERVQKLLTRNQLPICLKEPLSLSKLMDAMQIDKKNRKGRLRFVTMKSLGRAVTTSEFDPSMIKALWKEVGAE